MLGQRSQTRPRARPRCHRPHVRVRQAGRGGLPMGGEGTVVSATGQLPCLYRRFGPSGAGGTTSPGAWRGNGAGREDPQCADHRTACRRVGALGRSDQAAGNVTDRHSHRHPRHRPDGRARSSRCRCTARCRADRWGLRDCGVCAAGGADASSTVKPPRRGEAQGHRRLGHRAARQTAARRASPSREPPAPACGPGPSAGAPPRSPEPTPRPAPDPSMTTPRSS